MAVDTSRENRTERIQARAAKQAKELLETAAAMQGVRLSEFVLTSALERATETVHAHRYVQLITRVSRSFAEALTNPRGPNEALLAARKRYVAGVER